MYLHKQLEISSGYETKNRQKEEEKKNRHLRTKRAFENQKGAITVNTKCMAIVPFWLSAEKILLSVQSL